MKKVFLTFGDGGENFVAARERLANEARLCGEFDEILSYGLKDASEASRNSPLKDYKRGCGYWMWKPDIIDAVLAKMDYGDILVWCDSGNVVRRTRQWKSWFRVLQEVDIVFHRISACALHFNRREAMALFSPESHSIAPMLRMCFHFESGTMLMRKTDLSVALIGEWKHMMFEHPECVRDVIPESEQEKQLPTFWENRHDQTMLSLIVYKYLSNPKWRNRIRSVWDFHRGLNVFSDPCIIIARNRSGNVYRTTFKRRLIRAAYFILWRLQLMLERHGLQICWAKLKNEKS